MQKHLPHCRGGACHCERNLYFILAGLGLLLIAGITIGALRSKSLALWAEAGHALVDECSFLLSAYIASKVRLRHAEEEKIRRCGAFMSLALFGITALWIVQLGFERLSQPKVVEGAEMTVFAIMALAIAMFQAGILNRVGEKNITHTAARAHLLEDIGQNVVAILGGVLIWATGLSEIDLIASALITIYVIVRLLRKIFSPHMHHH